ncbi:zinc finger protein 398-like [Varanus komodoensis]|uniref:zinc finger protein 398-like n=1 Tax=Varanus komodoensis TaxID=61221 RepID=UPI001CF7B21E|nr:zinc finger protein 398-like [Varanus komodoensis]
MQAVERKVDVHAGRLLALEQRAGVAERKLSGTETALAEFSHHLDALGTLVQEYGQLRRRLENMENLLKNQNFWILRLPPGASGESPKVPVSFDEVSVCFSEQEWENPGEWQRELCRSITRGRCESLVSLDYAIARPDLLSQMERGEQPGAADRVRPEEEGAPRQIGTEFPPAVGDAIAFVQGEIAPAVGGWDSEDGVPGADSSPGAGLFAQASPGDEAEAGAAEACGARPETQPQATLPFPAEGLACAAGQPGGEEAGECGPDFGDFTTIIVQEGALPGVAPYLCPDCGKSFLYEEQCLLHQRTHPRAAPEPGAGPPPRLRPGGGGYACPECARCFPHPASLSRHRQWHASERPHTCAECRKSFRLKINLRLHERTHAATGGRAGSYICGQCGRGFSHHSNFLRHQMIHTGERPYACGECGKTFIRKEHLATHGRLHTGERPYKCPHCQKSFTRKQHLVGHQRLHEGPLPWPGGRLPQKPPRGQPDPAGRPAEAFPP